MELRSASRLTLGPSPPDAPASHPDRPPLTAAQRRELLAKLAAPALAIDVLGRERLVTAPALARAPMGPRGWPRRLLLPGLLPFVHEDEERSPRTDAVPADATRGSLRRDPRDPLAGWQRAAIIRRAVLLGLVLSQTYIGVALMTAVLPYHGRQPLEIAILILFAVLFGWISAGFWTAIAGFSLLLFGSDRYAISRTAPHDGPIDAQARVAVVMPICNENVVRVFAGLRASYDSLARTGELDHFDFYVLSDSGDPDTRVAEIAAWVDLCRSAGAFGRVFYRRRQHRIKRKSGNIADFCRRWGKNYRYMVIFDADSIMSGACLARLLRLMEANPGAGIIQTAPRAAGRETFYARVQQFATRVYGPLYTAGLHFWQLGESHYWGHNAIIRMRPFMRHCALGRLPGRGTLSGEILSHDFVEAALMRRAGWAVVIAYDLAGSYEEMPPNLLDELKRDRRWCQGNLMNFRLFLMRGLHVAHRAVFMSGVMAYLSAPLWFAFLIISTALLAVHTLTEPRYFIEPFQLFPLWPEWHPEWALMLVASTATLLFLPKVLAVALIAARAGAAYGGSARLTVSMLGELLLSTLFAPIRMLFHTGFVVTAFAGWRTPWKSPPREDAETSWPEAIRRHGLHTLLGVVWTGAVYWLNPSFLWWLLPVVGALIMSIPLSVYTSRVSLGRRLRAARLFLVPEESAPPEEISATFQTVRAAMRPPGFVEAVVDPAANALICATGVPRKARPAQKHGDRSDLAGVALRDGPRSLSAAQKTRLLDDPIALYDLHRLVWSSPAAHADWVTARE